MSTSNSPRRISRRAVLKAAAALPLVTIWTRPARAAEFTYKLATGQSLNQPINARLKEAVDRIREASSGRLEIRFFPASQLGSDTDLLSQTRSGAVELLNISGSVLSTVIPLAAITNLGFAFSGYDQVWRGVDGDLGKLIRAQIDKSGYVSVSKAADNGFRQITSATKPIKAPEDLRGYRIRVPVSPMFTSLFQTLGANPTSINFNELYTALQTHLVDGQENGLVTIEAGKLYEVQKYVAETNHIWDPFWLLANPRAFNALPDDLKTIVRREFDRASVEQRADVARLNTSLKSQLSGKGLTFVPADREAFRAALSMGGFYTQWRDKFGGGPWSALAAVTGKIS